MKSKVQIKFKIPKYFNKNGLSKKKCCNKNQKTKKRKKELRPNLCYNAISACRPVIKQIKCTNTL